jgi:hypothetical protein
MKHKVTKFLVVFAVLFLASYVYFASTMSSLGYELGKKDKSLSQLRDLKNELIVEFANHQNPDYLFEQGEQLSLVEIKTVSRYIDTRVTTLGRISP